MMNRADLRAALSHPNVQAFARVVREGESRQDDWAYRMRYGGLGKRPEYFQSFDDHPRIYEPTVGGKRSSAAGAYQATATTWDEERRKYGWPDFSPGCQDEFFVARLLYRGAIKAVMDGNLEEACRLCKDEWTSLPGGSEENAATARARETYLKWGGYLSAAPVDTLATEHYGEAVTESTVKPVPSADEQEAHMAPVIIPLLQVAAQFLPQIAGLFGSGSEVANRNLAAGKVLADAIVTATNSPNLQAAVEKMAADPEAAKAARAAVAEVMTLGEVGGGIVEARKAAYDTAQVPWWMNPAVIVAVLVLPLVYMVVSAVVFGVGGQAWSDDVKTLTVTAILSGALGSITGFFLGSSLGSQRKTAMLGKE